MMFEKKIKILNIVLDGRIGGPQLRVTELAGKLSEKYLVETVVVLPNQDSGELQDRLIRIKIRSFPVRLHKLSKSPALLFKWMLFFLPEVMSLKKVIKQEDPDIIHCNGSWQWKGIIAASGSGKKLLWHMNDTRAPFFVRVAFKMLKHKANAFLAEGNRVKQYYFGENYKSAPVFISQAPVDTEKFDPGVVIADSKICSLPGKKIVTTGNVNPCKGLEYFIDAAKDLNKKFNDLNFFIVGNLFRSQADYIKMLKTRIEKFDLKNVHFFGYSNNIPAVLKAADIYVCASVTEASPQSVWEAMAMEKAIVSTDVGSVTDFIEDGKNGYIVSPGDPQALAEGISKFLDAPSSGEAFGRKAREVAASKLDINQIADEHYRAYKKILNEKRKN